MEKNPYEIDFEEYIRHTDASKKDKTLAWSTAIGLQQVDGLKPSSYLYETAKKNIEGELSFDEANVNNQRAIDDLKKKIYDSFIYLSDMNFSFSSWSRICSFVILSM